MKPRALARSSSVAQGVEVGEGVGDHDVGHALGPVEAGEGVGVLDQAGRAAQRAPQFVHHPEVGPARAAAEVGERGWRRRRSRTRSSRCTASRR